MAASDNEQTVSVPLDALRLLYECALDFDARIPPDNGGGWAQVFHELFSEDTVSDGSL